MAEDVRFSAAAETLEIFVMTSTGDHPGVSEIESSTSRISDLVGAIKEYTHMDQPPVQNVDIVKSLETTLTTELQAETRSSGATRLPARSTSGEFVWQRAQPGLDEYY